MKKHKEKIFLKAIILVLLIFILSFQLPLFSPFSEGRSFKLTQYQVRYRSTTADINFSQTSQFINISDNITLLVAQTWLPVDEYPPPNETTRLFPCIANNESEKRYWYWNNQFINYIEKDLETIMIINFPDVSLQPENLIRFPNLTSFIMIHPLRGDPLTSQTFLPEIACFRFNVTYLPNMSNLFSANSNAESARMLSQWENTTYGIEDLLKSLWYVDNFTFREDLFSPGYPTPPIHFFVIFVFLTIITSIILFTNIERIKLQIKKLRR